jgi:RNase H-like domain found in reverse transcriptase/Reverse transcriptase (RNA-dependent DNA polymerase)
MIGKGLLVYLDDVTVYSATFEDHMKDLEEVFKKLRLNGLFIKPSKCVIATHKVHLLGFIIDESGVRTDPEKVRAVAGFPIPTDRTEVKSFLGLASYYRKLIKDFGIIARPLYQLTSKTKPFLWTPEHQEAFDHLKALLCSEPILVRPDWTQGFTLYTDASSKGLGAVLTQNGHPVEYLSRVTSKAESKYGPTKLECLAVIWAVKKLHYYLAQRHFDIVTDHSALKWLFTMKDPQALFARWKVTLAAYDCTIHYRKGTQNKNTDALSRNPVQTLTTQKRNGTQGRGHK